MRQLSANLRFAVRSLRKSPSLTAAIVLTLALCIGATAAIFSAVHAVLFRPLPYARPHQVLWVRETWQGHSGSMSAGNWIDTRRRDRLFEYLVPTHPVSLNLAGSDAPENVTGARVGADYFALLGVHPALGRSFLPEEEAPGRESVALLSDGLWRRRFGADPAVVGRTVPINGRPYTVVGVMPATLDYTLFDEELWIPTGFTADRLAMHDEHYLTVLGRLRPEVTLAQAQEELTRIGQSLAADWPQDNADRGLIATPLMDELVRDYRLRLLILLGAVGFVLLIACANIANLLLARASARSREIAIRTAVGAGRGHILRQALTESMVLALVGGTLGLLLAYWGVGALVAAGPADVPRLAQARVGLPVLGFTLLVTVASGFLFGLAPAFRMAGRPPHEALREGGRTGPAAGRDRLRGALVVAEIALALVLLTGAGLLIRSAVALGQVDPGFDPANVLAGRVSLPAPAYETPERIGQTFQAIARELQARPGVGSAALVSAAPLEDGNSNGLVPEGRPLDVSSAINSLFRLVTPAYFETMRIRLVRGRAFTEQDRAGAPRVMIINETLARQAFPGQSAVGKRIACCESAADGTPLWKEVVGIVADVRALGLGQEPAAEFYLPMAQAPAASWDWLDRTMSLAVRTTGDPAEAAGALRSAVWAVDRSLPVYDVGTMTARVTGSLAQSRFSTALLSIFGALALLLAAIGVYGVISYGVTQRRQEIGIRMALGARERDVLGLVVGHGAALAGVGLALGLAGALALTRLLSSLLFRVSPTDPATFAAGLAVLSLVALAAATLPARRAAQLDPALALRSE